MKKLLEFIKNRQKRLNLAAAVLSVVIVGVVIWGCAQGRNPLHMRVDDGIEWIDLDTIHLKSSDI